MSSRSQVPQIVVQAPEEESSTPTIELIGNLRYVHGGDGTEEAESSQSFSITSADQTFYRSGIFEDFMRNSQKPCASCAASKDFEDDDLCRILNPTYMVIAPLFAKREDGEDGSSTSGTKLPYFRLPLKNLKIWGGNKPITVLEVAQKYMLYRDKEEGRYRPWSWLGEDAPTAKTRTLIWAGGVGKGIVLCSIGQPDPRVKLPSLPRPGSTLGSHTQNSSTPILPSVPETSSPSGIRKSADGEGSFL